MATLLCPVKSTNANVNGEFEEFDANLDEGTYEDFDAALEQQQQINVQAQAPVAPVAGMMPTGGLMADDGDDYAQANASANGAGESQPGTLADLIKLQQHTNTLLAHFISNTVNDAHQRTLKAYSAGSNNVTREVNLFAQGTLRGFADKPHTAVFKVPAGVFPHTNGTLLDVTILERGSVFAASMMLHTDGIKSSAEPTVVSASGVQGVCLIAAKSNSTDKVPIVTSNESEFTRSFKEAWPGVTAENLMKDVSKRLIKKDGKIIGTKYLFDADHPIASLLIKKYKDAGMDHSKQWSSLNECYTFDEAEVLLAKNDLTKKLVVEDTAVDLDRISFPFTRAVVSEAAMKDRTATAIKNRWLDTEEIGAYIKSGNAEAELDKKGYIWAKARITYAPSPGSERTVAAPASSTSSNNSSKR